MDYLTISSKRPIIVSHISRLLYALISWCGALATDLTEFLTRLHLYLALSTMELAAKTGKSMRHR